VGYAFTPVFNDSVGYVKDYPVALPCCFAGHFFFQSYKQVCPLY